MQDASKISISLKMAAYGVSRWLSDLEKQSFHVLEHAYPVYPENGKCIPFAFVLVPRV